MTNFEWITQDVDELTVWLADMADCDFCPARKKCKKDYDNGKKTSWHNCFKSMREWLESKA